MNRITIGFFVFPGMLQLDFTGAHAVLAAGPQADLSLIWKEAEPVLSSDRLLITPTVGMAECPPLDVLVVPGGEGVLPLLSDETVLHFLRQQAQTAKYTASVCTGALVLGAAGLLRGYTAVTHWLSQDLLPLFGAQPGNRRVIVDRNRITCAGVTSSIDMGLVLAGLLWGRKSAQAIQLTMEYDPEPPFAAGNPDTAPPALVEEMRKSKAKQQSERLKAIRDAVARLEE